MFSLVIVLSLAAFSNAGLLGYQRNANQGINSPNNLYLPPSSPSTGLPPSAINSYTAQAPITRQIAIVRQVNENNGDGAFTYSFETEDGQTAEARGQLQADGAEGSQTAQGSYSFTAPDGQRYTVSYTAGQNGFEAQGAHLPVAPPVPEAILKALADNAADEARGIFDDGTYREESSVGQRTQQGAQIGYQYQQNTQSGYQYQQNTQTGYQQGGPSGYQRAIPSRPFRF